MRSVAAEPVGRAARKIALINPNWSFDGSIYFGCREPHLPLEYGYAESLLQRAGHDVQIVDAQLDGLSSAENYDRVAAIRLHFAALTTAASDLAWRCPPPEV